MISLLYILSNENIQFILVQKYRFYTSNARPRTRSALSRRNIVFELSANNLSIQFQTATLPLVHFYKNRRKNFFLNFSIKNSENMDTEKN